MKEELEKLGFVTTDGKFPYYEKFKKESQRTLVVR